MIIKSCQPERRLKAKKSAKLWPCASLPSIHDMRVRVKMANRSTESGITTLALLLKRLESNGDKRNYLSSWEENVERRPGVVSKGSAETRRYNLLADSGFSGDFHRHSCVVARFFLTCDTNTNITWSILERAGLYSNTSKRCNTAFRWQTSIIEQKLKWCQHTANSGSLVP